MPMRRVSSAIVALAASSSFWVPSATAFEVGGVASGMTFAEVKDLAEMQGWTIEQGPQDEPTDYRLLKPGGESASIQFCDEHLFGLSAHVPDGFRGFAELVDGLTKSYGNPTVSADTSPDGFEPVIASLSFSWTHDGGERIDVSYGAADDLSRAGLQLNPNAVFLVSAAMAVCGRDETLRFQPH